MDFKQQAAAHAVQYVRSGMRLGLGTGSTSTHFINLVGERLRSGELRDLVGVPTSQRTIQLACQNGISLVSLAEAGELDLAVDGADEIDTHLNLIKGLGHALLREKIVEMHARQFVIIADESKFVARLGQGPLPVEIVPFEAEVHVRWLRTVASRAELWLDERGQPYQTDNGNFLVRCWFEAGIADTYALAQALNARPGIVEHGLFLDMAHRVVLAGPGGVRCLERPA
jgi:ribose 5-phosphate isomerase A